MLNPKYEMATKEELIRYCQIKDEYFKIIQETIQELDNFLEGSKYVKKAVDDYANLGVITDDESVIYFVYSPKNKVIKQNIMKEEI